MNARHETFFTLRIILSILSGSAAAILLITMMRNYILATILGMLVTVIVSDRLQPKSLTILGSLVGSVAGLYWGGRNYALSASGRINFADPLFILALFGGLLLSGLLCAIYGWIIGKLLVLYRKGRGPFF